MCVSECVFISFKVAAQKSTFLIEKTNRGGLRRNKKGTALKYEEYDRIMLRDILKKYCQ